MAEGVPATGTTKTCILIRIPKKTGWFMVSGRPPNFSFDENIQYITLADPFQCESCIRSGALTTLSLFSSIVKLIRYL